jgi:glutathione synthase/RimK-type ligase-like ATP-grasp enzyme
MVRAWIITRNLSEDDSNLLDSTEFKSEKDNNVYEAIKVKHGFKKLGIDCKLIKLSELKSDVFISRMVRDDIPDIVVVRCMLWTTEEVNMLTALSNRGIIVLNNSRSQILCMNKWFQYKELNRAGVAIPKTGVTPLLYSTEEILSSMQSNNLIFPIVVKSIRGSRADSVFKCNNVEQVIESIIKINKIYPQTKYAILQEWIDHRAKDAKGVISVLTFGDKFYCQQRRPNREMDFFISNPRANCDRNEYEITTGLKELVTKTIPVMGNIELSRFDVLHDGQKYLICEVNSPGAFTGYDLTMDMDCGLMVAEYALEKYKIDNKLN